MNLPALLAALLLPLPLNLAQAPKPPLVIAHRGASGLLPEHTLEAYERAIEQGADFIEPDLVVTRDGYLIARHENEIGGTTDVAQKFPERKRHQLIDGQDHHGWFTEDFSLAELKTLRATQRLSFRDQSLNGRYAVPTFQEILDLVARKQVQTGREIGIYPETKHSSHFRNLNLAIEPRLLTHLRNRGLDRADAPVFIQSFEVNNLQWLQRMSPVKRIQLIDDVGFPADSMGTAMSYANMVTPAGLRRIQSYATGIGPYKRWIVPEVDGHLQPATDLIQQAHALGLQVHPFTFRSDSQYLAADYKGQIGAEYQQFFALGVDGVFSDFTHDALAARQAWLHK